MHVLTIRDRNQRHKMKQVLLFWLKSRTDYTVIKLYKKTQQVKTNILLIMDSNARD